MGSTLASSSSESLRKAKGQPLAVRLKKSRQPQSEIHTASGRGDWASTCIAMPGCRAEKAPSPVVKGAIKGLSPGAEPVDRLLQAS